VVDPLGRAQNLGGQVLDVLRPGRLDDMRAQARADMRDLLRVPEPMLRAIGDGTVHLDPYETSTIWAYGLRWRPAPVFQTYSIYTHDVDVISADALRGDRAPDWILRQNVVRIVGRRPESEAPTYTIATLCEYTEVMVSEGWRLLRHTPGRCGPARELESRRAQPGEVVPVPAGAPDEIVYASFSIRVPILHRLRDLAFKPRNRPLLVLNEDYASRFALALAPGGFLMWAPEAVGGTDFAGGFGARVLRLSDIPSPFTVTFHAVRVAPPGRPTARVSAG
jgi:hypothetical protein